MSTYAKAFTQPFTLPQTYLKASAFVLLSVLVPQLMHQFSLAGTIFLPILFFTFFAAIRFGWAVGLLSAVASPLVSHALTGMPPGVILYVVLAQCVAIALLTGLFTKGKSKISFIQILAIIGAYQLIAFSMESLLLGGPADALYGIKTTIPGMLIQLIFFTLYSKYLSGKQK